MIIKTVYCNVNKPKLNDRLPSYGAIEDHLTGGISKVIRREISLFPIVDSARNRWIRQISTASATTIFIDVHDIIRGIAIHGK